MSTPEFFRSVGGEPAVRGGEVEWNFGILPPTPEVTNLVRSKPTLHQRFPALAGKWDGRSTVNHWDAIRRVLGDKAEDLIQMQPRGTCGGRAGSFGIDAVQCVMMAAGKRAKFRRASHAALYYMARKKYGMLGGGDGVAGGSIPEVMSEFGVTHREESDDPRWYGDGSDDVAVALGGGRMQELARRIVEAAKDNVVTEWATVRSAQELADGIASGGVGIGSDMQGFTMERDPDGFCRPTGTWSHYQVRISVGVWNGRKGFGYNQSWGKNTPSGTNLPGHPGNCFGVDFDEQDRIIRSGEWAVVFGFPLWDLESGNVPVDWIF